MKSLIPTRIAEMLYALIIGFFGVGHFMKTDDMKGFIPDFMPADPKIWVYVTGAGLVLAAIAILINKFKTLACYLLAAMLLVFVFTLHLKPAIDNGDMGKLLKDAAMAFAAIIIGNNTSK